MVYILTGLPKDKKDDLKVCQEFASYDGKKVICGSSTMKMYCKQLNINPKINIINTDNLPIVKYEIKGIDLATEGVITLNQCYQVLLGAKTDSQEVNQLAKILDFSQKINFIVGTADNNDQKMYKNFNLLYRKEIIDKIVKFLSASHKILVKYI